MTLQSRALRANDDGFGLIELVVALTVFMVLTLGAAQAMDASLRLDRTNRGRTVAANLAAQKMDELRSQASDPANWCQYTGCPATALLNNMDTTETVTVDNGSGVTTNYTVARHLEWGSAGATSACDTIIGSGTLNPQILRATVTVTPTAPANAHQTVVGTVLSPPSSQFDAVHATVGIKVSDDSGNPQPGIQMLLAGPVWLWGTTDSHGCVLFQGLPVGTYYAVSFMYGTAPYAPKYVDPDGNWLSLQYASVRAGEAHGFEFKYDQPSTLSATFAPHAAYAPVTVPDVGALGLTLYNSGMTGDEFQCYSNPSAYGKCTYPGGSPASIFVPDLFPFSSAYDVWAGACPDADPAAWFDTSNNPAPRLESVDTSPASAETATLHLSTEQLNWSLPSGSSLPQSLTFVATNVADAVDNATPPNPVFDGFTGCGSPPYQITLATISVSSTSGNFKIALPYGHWQFWVQGRCPHQSPSPNYSMAPATTGTVACTKAWPVDKIDPISDPADDSSPTLFSTSVDVANSGLSS